jgi:tetratricopeptide (TPR) repeat protein
MRSFHLGFLTTWTRLQTFSLALMLGACAGAGSQLPSSVPPRRVVPAVVTDASYADVERAFQRLDAQAPERAGLRERLVQHQLGKVDEAIAADRYAVVVELLAQITGLYTAVEIANHAWPDDLQRAALYLIAKGSPRGDEARVLSGLLLMRLAHPEDTTRAASYEALQHWGIDARADMSGPLENFVGLIEAWEEHARLTPTADVMATLVRLYVERRNALIQLFQSTEEQVPLSASVFQGVQRTAFDVAGVFLKQGDTASALSQLRALGPSGGIENKLGELLDAASEEGNEGADALLDLSRVYLEGARPDIARALCASGVRSRPDDARFPRCLARVASIENDYPGALAWYADALALVPEERALYDEILEVLSGLIAQGAFDADAVGASALATRATQVLKERMRRWPSTASPVAPSELYAAIATAAMNAGNAKDAEGYFLESLQAQTSAATLVQYGLLLERVGRPQDAAARYQQALVLATGNASGDARPRAEIWEHIGDASRASGDRDAAQRAYEKGLLAWRELGPVAASRRAGLAPLRRGVLLGRLGRATEAKVAFREAMDAAPGARETYATILAFLVVSQPDAAFAHEVFRSAQNQAGLAPEWKVYFALWQRMIASRSGEAIETDVSDVLAEFAKGDGWSAKLASFGAGSLSYEALLEQAATLGERAEAYFYEGARRLSANDVAGAHQFFAQVLATQMVSFFEFAMAQELLGAPVAAPVAAPPQAGTTLTSNQPAP